MRATLFLLALLGFNLSQGADVGCNLSYDLNGWGTCTQNGCCEFTAQNTDPSLCDGSGETCCYSTDLCPPYGPDFCFRTYGTWVSRYNFHASESEVHSGFQALKDKGITRVYFNIWADGSIYANSATAINNGASFIRDSLQWAVSSARTLGLEIYAWFEYGTQAHYGTSPDNSFSAELVIKDWLLYNLVDGQKVYTTPDGGNYVWTDPTNPAVQQFFADMTADIVRNYDLDGIQYDDHMAMPNGFDTVDNIGQSTRFTIMEEFMLKIRDAVYSAAPGTKISYSPSPISFSETHHNVRWENYLLDGIVDEVAPQYYRTTAGDYLNTLNQDLPYVQGHQTAMLGGIRLSGSGGATPSGEVDRMIEISYEKKLKGVSFWFADDIILGTYVPPTFVYC
ncbi:hypothetical protein SK128_026327 [Halocaridina rubra]|uniref:Glycosyl hydrolase-like 10 domain-containing protein n=1 Tax=Halocaridina rubra TaxID=373956 RepID=A0AAN8X2B4_HALRR